MADNFLERRAEEIASRKSPAAAKRPSLDRLLTDNRSCRGYDQSYVVHRLQLEAIVGVNVKLASGNNAQRLRFKLITRGEDSLKVQHLIHLGGALPELHLPFPGTAPEAFIIVCATCPENAIVCIDAGISMQSMLLKATEMHLSGIIIRNFDAEKLKSTLNLPYAPIAVVAVGKGAERIELVDASDKDNLKYYRESGIHKVPKLSLKDIIL